MSCHIVSHSVGFGVGLGILLALTSCEPQPRRQLVAIVPAAHAASDGGRASEVRPAPPAPAHAPPKAADDFFADYREVVPGLLVTTSGVPVSDDTTAAPRRILTIRQNGRIIYADTTADFLYRDPDEPEMALYPLWVPTGLGRGELLVRVATPPDLDFLRRFVVSGQHVVCRDTLPAFNERARNLDQDPALEFSGVRYSSEVIGDDGHGYLSTTYSPLLCYEVRPTGLVLDTALTIRRTRARYGKFYGFKYLKKQVIRQDMVGDGK